MIIKMSPFVVSAEPVLFCNNTNSMEFQWSTSMFRFNRFQVKYFGRQNFLNQLRDLWIKIKLKVQVLVIFLSKIVFLTKIVFLMFSKKNSMLPLKKSSRQNKNVDLLANSIETANELSYRIDGLFWVIQTGLILFF